LKLIRITTVPISLKLLITGQMKFMQAQGWEVLAVSADGPEVPQVVQQEGVRHQVIPFTRVISPLHDLWCLWRLIRLMRRERPDIVHTHTPKAGLLGMLAARICGVKGRLHTVAGLPLMEATGWKHTLLRQTEHLTYVCATHIYPNSLHLATYLRDHFPRFASKLKVLGQGSSNGIDLEEYKMSEALGLQAQQLREKWSLSADAFVWCFVGRLVGDKGIHELVRSFVRLYDDYPNQRLLLVGPFEDEKDGVCTEVKDIIATHEGILSVGFQVDVKPWMALANAFVFPSYREGFPNVVLQAAALGLPCIVTDINGCNEIISDGKNGRIIPPKNEEALTHAMNTLLLSPDTLLEMSNSARSAILGFDRMSIWKELLAEYNNLR
jgi:glycosyltransferase involved in cell wall biosynthesis